MNQKIQYSFSKGIATLVIDSDTQNTIDLQFIEEFRFALKEILKTEAKVLIVESAKEDFFCNGFNPDVFLEATEEQIKNAMRQLLLLGNEQFFYPLPTISVISGYAAGGGAFIAIYNDFRFMSKNKSRIGFTEVHLSMTIPSLALEILSYKIGLQNTLKAVITGRMFKAEECLKYNLVDEVFENFEDTKKAAYRLAKQISELPLSSLKSLKQGTLRWIPREHFATQIEKDLEEIGELMSKPECKKAFSLLKQKKRK
ncbi:MAG: enoyl-CoA hydratase/isomerase family protein [Leptonema sp. (in: bacteria)]